MRRRIIRRALHRAGTACLVTAGWMIAASCDGGDGTTAGDGGSGKAARDGASPTTAAPDANGNDNGDGIIGTSCEYLCTGPSCNLRCENGVIYRCPSSGSWVLERDCAAQGQDCQEILIDGGPAGDVICVPAGDEDGG